jgi:uncharacterized protein YneF (UPF0154 family)
MSNGEQAPAKKGLPIWAWVGIGCGGLLILVLIVVMAAGFFVAKKVKDVAGDFEDNPAMATAKMIVKVNPELEEVATDEEAGTITVRNKKTGEVVTVNFDDIQDGKLSFTTDEGEVKVDASQLDENGSMTVTSGDGSVVVATGKPSAKDLPSWVPMYPGTEPTSRHSMRTETTLSGGFEITTEDAVADVLEFYRSELESAGYEISVNTYTQDETEGGMVNGNNEAEHRSIIVILSREAGENTKAVVSFNEGS